MWQDILVKKNSRKRLSETSPDQQSLATILFHTERENCSSHNNLDNSVNSGSQKICLGTLETEFLEDDGRVVVHAVHTGPLLPEHPVEELIRDEMEDKARRTHIIAGREQR